MVHALPFNTTSTNKFFLAFQLNGGEGTVKINTWPIIPYHYDYKSKLVE